MSGSIRWRLTSGFWRDRHRINSDSALLYQWERYEEAGTVDNFRIAAGMKEGKRRGFFYTDSDLHKWADAASRLLALGSYPEIEKKLDEYIAIISAAVEEDGYLFTFNQIHFPGVRWKNFQIEHELYCHGHLIEAGVEHHRSTGRNDLLGVAIRAADCIRDRFVRSKPRETPGHQEIELALIRLYRVTGDGKYLSAAGRFLEARGRMLFPGLNLLKEFVSHSLRMRIVKKADGDKGTGAPGFDFTENLTDREPPLMGLRAAVSFLSGKYQQQHRPVMKQRVPVGHSVRWAYQSTALAMLYRETGDDKILAFLESLWQTLADRYMYVTGGIGSLPVIEGFGREYELDDGFAYCETCAAIGSVFWNAELLAATGKARYAEMLEWQLYNAASVGIALDGRSYFYRNPLLSRGNLERRGWFDTACCPSNISRLWASVPSYVCSGEGGDIRIHQYISGSGEIEGLSLSMDSRFPWEGDVKIDAKNTSPEERTIQLRVPGWVLRGSISIDGVRVVTIRNEGKQVFGASLFERAFYYPVRLGGNTSSSIVCDFNMAIRALESPVGVKGKGDRISFARGPLVYCAESADLGKADIENFEACPDSAEFEFLPGLCGGMGTLRVSGTPGTLNRLVPYFAWGNRGRGAMSVWLKNGGSQ